MHFLNGAGRESRTPRSSAWKAAGGPITCLPALASREGLEPPQTVLETVVLPLHYRDVFLLYITIVASMPKIQKNNVFLF